MNIEEAREIFNNSDRYKNEQTWIRFCEAKGFIEGYESNLKKIGVLKKALERIRIIDSPIYKGNHAHPLSARQIIAHEALKTVEGKPNE